MDIFKKCYDFKAAKEVMDMGIYPYFHPVESGQNPVVRIHGKNLIMAGSNNYLGLTNDRRLKTSSIKAIMRYGVGCVGSRFLNGTLTLHEELERKIAEFMNKESALTFTTGMQTNLGIISALVNKNDFVIIDKYNHASIVDGCRLSFGQIRRFKHNDMNDLEKTLASIPQESGKLIVVDGVFSMEGDIAPLPDIVKLAKKYKARLMVDDAHGIGVLGKNGRGSCEVLGVENNVDLIMSSFSKAFAGIGGFVAGSKEIIHYLKHHARSLIFSASLPPAVVASVLTALEIIKTEPQRRKRISQNADYLRKSLKSLGFDTGTSENTPIIPVIIGDNIKAFTMWKKLFDEGIFTTPIVSPAVPEHRSLIRVSAMATHKKIHLNKIINAFKKVGSELGIISQTEEEKRKSWIEFSITDWMKRLLWFNR